MSSIPARLDTISDKNNAGLHRLVQLYGDPGFAKSASADDLRPARQLDPAYYGDPRDLGYPLHTKAAVWANYGLFLENQKAGCHKPIDAEIIEERILHAGRVHGIDGSLHLLKEAAAKDRPATDDDLPDEAYAIVWKNADGSKERYMPMRNGRETIKAAEYLQQYRDRVHFPYEIRQEVAERIREKAAELGATLSSELREFVEKQAGYGACANADAVGLLVERVTASRRGPGELVPEQIEMVKLAEALQKQPLAIRESEIRIKVAAAVDVFDRRMRLTAQVRDGLLPRAEDVLFSLTREKMAAAINSHATTITGSIYHLGTLQQLKLAAVREVIGDDVASAMSADGLHVNAEKCAAVLPTLDRGTARLFDRLMEDSGLSPVAKEASATAVHIGNTFLAELNAANNGY